MPGDAGLACSEAAPTVSRHDRLAQEVERRRSRRRRFRCRRSGSVMLATVRVLVDVDGDRLERAAAGERPPLELRDRRAHRRRVHVRRLDDDVRRQRRAGERLLHPLVRLDHVERLRERLRPLQARGAAAAPARRARAAARRRAPPTARAGAGRGRRSRPRSAPSPSSRRSRPTSGTRSRSTLSPSLREHGGKHGQRPEHRDGDDEDRGEARARRRSGRRSGTCRPSPTITVRPEMSTERPEVAAAAASAASLLRPAARSCRSRFK